MACYSPRHANDLFPSLCAPANNHICNALPARPLRYLNAIPLDAAGCGCAQGIALPTCFILLGHHFDVCFTNTTRASPTKSPATMLPLVACHLLPGSAPKCVTL